MIAFADEEDRRGQRVMVVTSVVGATVSKAIIEVLANSSYVTTEADRSPPKSSNIFETKYSRQREWWNTPRKERRRKK